MPGGGISLAATADVERVEAPVTLKTYLMCAFAAFGGIFFGYDSGYISGVLGMNFYIHVGGLSCRLKSPSRATPLHLSLG